MSEPVLVALTLAYAYLLGSVSSAYLVGRLIKGIDLRRVGTGTLGASNVYYNVGRFWIVPVGVFDLFVKGLTPAYLAMLLDLDIAVQAAASMLVIVGHNWPLYLGFKGGRGVAPTVGVLLAMGRLELAYFMVLGAAGWQFTRASAVWVLLAFASLPLASLYFQRPAPVVLLMVGLLLVTVVKRLTANSVSGASDDAGGVLRLLYNRLLFDRDIADHGDWVRRNANGPEALE